MGLQDLTPELRTRLSRVERAVGWFVILAVLLLVAGFLYYVRHTAQRKGWFVPKVTYSTGLNTATGIKPGDPVRLMGFTIGEVTRIIPNAPGLEPNVWIFFQVRQDTNNYCGYIWHDSKVRVSAVDLLGNRSLEVIKGDKGVPTVYVSDKDPTKILGILNKACLATYDTFKEAQKAFKASADKASWYVPYQRHLDFYLRPAESPALTERLEQVVNQAEQALPNILDLTNQINLVLTNAAVAITNLDARLSEAQPTVSNATVALSNITVTLATLNRLVTNVQPDVQKTLEHVAIITAHLREPNGSLGQWLMPAGLSNQLDLILSNANATVSLSNTNLSPSLSNLNHLIFNLASLTSNLNAQVQANSNILGGISALVTNTDHFVQGLKRHWLLRSAFKTRPAPSTNAPPVKTVSPRDAKK